MLLAVGAGTLPAQAPPPTGTITVQVTGLRAEQGGTLLVQLYDRPSAWLLPDSARALQQLPVSADSLTIRFDSLPYDTAYAIAVIHDRNGNGKLDMRWFPFPKPKEGAGVSGNHTRMGKPRYQQATFALEGPETRQEIVLRY